MACATTVSGSDVLLPTVAKDPIVKRPRLTFSVAPGSQRQASTTSGIACGQRTRKSALACFAATVDDLEDEESTLPSTPSAPSKPCVVASTSFKTSSNQFEKFRGSLRAKTGPLFSQYISLLSSERGLSSGADRDVESLGLGRLGEVVGAMVQLADLRTEQQHRLHPQDHGSSNADEADDDLTKVACELFEILCVSVQALPTVVPGLSAIPPDVYMEALQKQWGGIGEGDVEVGAARAAALFRMKDTVSSLYAWGLVTRAAAEEITSAIRDVIGQESIGKSAAGGHDLPLCFLDPVAGTGLHGAIFRHFGTEAVMADYVAGGSTQTCGSDMQYLLQRTSEASSSRTVIARTPVVWLRSENRDVFDDTSESQAWWRSHATNTALFLSFPPPPPSTVAEVALRRFQGNWLVFVGEWRGCTATSAFFDELDSTWKVIRKVELPRWPMMDDWAWVLQRQK